MKASWRFVATMVVVAMLTAVGAPAFATSDLSRDLVLPEGRQVSDHDLHDTKGEGLITGLIGAGVGAMVGYGTYLVDYAWDVYVAGEDRTWSWSDAAKETVKGAVAGGLAAAFVPAP